MAPYQNGTVQRMMKRMPIYSRYDVVKVPFPFTDQQAQKVRPALIISSADTFNTAIGHSVLAMITSAKQSSWPLDTPIHDLNSAGLPAPSLIRLKLFTLDHRLIISSLGQLSAEDQQSFQQHFKQLISA